MREKYIQSYKKNSLWKVFYITLILGFLFILGVFTFQKISNISFDISFIKNFQTFSPFQNEERINVLLVGIGGETNDAPNLTDTIILASVNLKKKTVSLLSIPRDLYVLTPELGDGRKINQIYARYIRRYGKQQALQELKKKVESITAQEIDYYALVDFDGFMALIDVLWGLEITVPESLTDEYYPDGNWGYETFHISAGTQKIDGQTALKYARSRHSSSDFSRSHRQQLIIQALKDQLVSGEILTSPGKIRSFFEIGKKYIYTNIGISDILGLAPYLVDIPTDQIISFQLNDTCFEGSVTCMPGGFLYAPVRELFDNQMVLLPNGANIYDIEVYDEIQLFSYLISNYPEIYIYPKNIHIFNTTTISGLARRVAEKLKSYWFSTDMIDGVSSLRTLGNPRTQILYDMDNIEINSTLEALQMIIFADQIPENMPKFSLENPSDIEIVLDENALLFLE